MLFQRAALMFILLIIVPLRTMASPDNTQLAVWANEAIVATYTYDYKNYLPRQQEIAHYFTSTAWINYSTALQNSKLPESVIQNSYSVSAVATLPPTIKTIAANHWQAVMPILVIYKNSKYQQKQTLEVTLDFQAAPNGQGVRGLAIINLKADVSESACQCVDTKTHKMALT